MTAAIPGFGIILGAAIDVARGEEHSKGEEKITIDEYHEAIDAARTEYLKTFGQDAFFEATGCKQVAGCSYDDTKLPHYLIKAKQ